MQSEGFQRDAQDYKKAQDRQAVRNDVKFGYWQANPDVSGNSMMFLFTEGLFAGVTIGVNEQRDTNGKETYTYYVLPSSENPEHHVPASGEGFQTQSEADEALMKYLQRVKQERTK